MPPVIDMEQCVGCGTCVDLCTEDVFFGTKGFGTIHGEKPEITYPEACHHCYLCVLSCPNEALSLRTPLSMTVPYK